MIKNILVISLVFLLCSFSVVKAEDSPMKISSPAFKEGDSIPVEYTCDGRNISPELDWQNVPAGTKSLALIVEDPDAPSGTWVHWVVDNIPPESHSLLISAQGAAQLTNSFGKTGYGGPCPPKGKGPHRYFFRLYALDNKLNLYPENDAASLKKWMKGQMWVRVHILATAELMGRYEH